MFCFEVATVVWHGRNSIGRDENKIMHRDKHKYLDGIQFIEYHPSPKNDVSGYIQIFAGSKESKLGQ